MRVVFMGTPEFSASILEELAGHFDVVGVYTRPDAVRKRGSKLVPSPVKAKAQSLGIPVFDPPTPRTYEVLSEIAALEPDVICVAAYGALLPREILEIPPMGCLNVHTSLLPRWRGAAPIERAILAGDESVGVCIMRMEEGLDTGPYCVSRSIPVGDANAEELLAELADLGARSLITALSHIETGTVFWTAQDESKATYAAKIEKGELDLSPAEDATTNVRRVRASGAAHPSHCEIGGRRVTVLAARTLYEEERASLSVPAEPGQAVFAAKRLILTCAEGALEVLELKPDGKKAMDARSFTAGMPALREGSVSWEAE